jgi:hypothetical protein
MEEVTRRKPCTAFFANRQRAEADAYFEFDLRELDPNASWRARDPSSLRECCTLKCQARALRIIGHT